MMQTKSKVHTQYKDSKGNRLPSVTTVLNILAKPALLEWAWKLGTEGIDYKSVRDNAADIGTLAHSMILCDLKGEKPDTSEYSTQDIDKAENSLMKYWDWRKGKFICPMALETPFVSQRYLFGGTVDFYGSINDIPTLIDFKTGKAIYSEAYAQVAAYTQLLSEHGYPIKETHILRVGRDEVEGFEDRALGDLTLHWQLFEHCLAIYNLQKKIR